MAFEFESLIGYLYVVGGRQIHTAPPGTLCEAAPARAARGREADTFFVMVSPSGDSAAPANFYERLSTLAADRYFASSGSVTAGLRDLFAVVNRHLYDYNQKNPQKQYEASMICAVLRGADLIIARCGANVAMLRSDGQTRTIPDDWTDDDALYSPPLGVRPEADIHLTQCRVNNGTRVAFGDANLAAMTAPRIDNALVSVDLATVLVSLKELAKLQLAVMVAEFVPPTASTPPNVPVAESTAGLSGRKRETATTPAVSRPREKRPSVFSVLWRHGQRALGRLLLQFGKVFGVFGKMINRYFGPEDSKQKRWLSSPAGMGTVVMLPVFVVAMVMALWLSGTEESEFEICLQELNSRYELARSPQIANSDRQRILETWGYVQDKVEDCGALRPGDGQVSAIRAEGQQVTDRLQDITRLQTTVIQSIPAASLTRIIAQGRNLFALDSANGQVYQITLTGDGLGSQAGFYPIPEMRRGASPGGFLMGDIIDIAYSPNTDRIVALADNGILVQCEVRFLDCRTERLNGVEQWRRPMAFTIWTNGTLYLLDAEAQSGQVWRYPLSGGTFTGSTPTEYFSGPARPTLQNPIDIQIDGGGNIYILTADGTTTKHFNAQQVNFGYTSFPESQRLNAAQTFFLDDTVTAQSIYVVSRNTRTIFETSLIGNFRASYRPPDESLFELVSAVAVVADQNRREILYVASGNTVFAMVKDD